jgi:hypothetical protein
MSALEDPGEADVDELVETIADAGPDDARTVVPEAQAEALIRRDVHGQSRPETAAAIDGDLTVYAVDDRLRRARNNTVAAVATVRRLLEADAIDDDADDDLDAIRRLLTSHEDAESAAETEDDDEADPEPDDPADRRNVLLLGSEPIPDRTDRLTDDDLDELTATVERTLAVDLDNLENGEILGTITLDAGTWSFNPAKELADDAQDEELAAPAHSGEDDEAEDDEEEEEEADGYSCEDCGDTFSSPGALGGHRKYCPERPETAA